MPLVGKKYNDVRVQLGEGKFDPDIEEQILGLQTGDETIIERRYPQQVAKKQVKDKFERFRVTVKNVEQEELPELNDDFVKSLNLKIETIDD